MGGLVKLYWTLFRIEGIKRGLKRPYRIRDIFSTQILEKVGTGPIGIGGLCKILRILVFTIGGA